MIRNLSSARPLSLRAGLPVAFAILLLLTIAPAARADGCVPLPPYGTEADRIGMNVIIDYGKSFMDYEVETLNAGWFIDYRPTPYVSSQASSAGSLPASGAEGDLSSANVLLPQVVTSPDVPVITTGMAYAPVIRVSDINGNWHTAMGRLVTDNPGMLWIIGNEPDRNLQDNLTPEEYVVVYHEAYETIKQLDPTANIAIAAVVEPTPLRRRYLDMILDEYRARYGKEMPIDVWNVHAFILREVWPGDYPPNSPEVWGAGIPRGTEDFRHEGEMYTVPNHGDIEILKQLIRDFRTWMAARGYRHTPLIVSEYGILLAPDYDAGNGRVYDHAFVSEYMRSSFDFFRSATNSSTGYPADGNRLVQAWSWFGLNNYVYSYPDREYGFNGNLFDHDTGQITPLGSDFAQYAGAIDKDYVDLAFRIAGISRLRIPAMSEGETVTINVSVYNRGNISEYSSLVRFWLGDPDNGGTLLAAHSVLKALPARCRGVWDRQITLSLPPMETGFYSLVVETVGASGNDGIPENDNAYFALEVGDTSDFERTHLPVLGR